MKLSIAIPCYNEEGNVKRIPEELMPILEKTGYDFEVIFIDDGSTDGTVNEVNSLGDNHIKLVSHGSNKGLGEAVKTAIKESAGDLLILLDADLTFHPREIPKLLDEYARSKPSCVIGSHLMRGGKMGSVQFYRKVLTRTLNFAYSIMFGKKLSSYSSIFRLYDLKILKKLKLTRSGFDINAEILFQLIREGYEIKEVPVTLGVRTIGESKIHTFSEIRNHMRLLYLVSIWRLKMPLISLWPRMKARYPVFFGVGVIGFLIVLSVSWLLTQIFGIWYLTSYIIATAIQLSLVFFLHGRISFKGHGGKGFWKRYFYFIVFYLAMAGINFLIMYWLVSLVGLNYIFSIFAVNIVLSLATFSFNHFFIFPK